MSSLSGLNAAPSTATRLPSKRPVADLAGQLDHPDPAAHVDVVDLAQEGQRLVGAELAGPGHERADVLGQAAAAEAEPGVEELAADPVVVADRVGELLDVGAGGLAELGHRVDERDLRGEEGVRRRLHHLGGGVVGDDDRACRRRRSARRPRRSSARSRRRPASRQAVDEPVGVQGVLDGEALAQELRVPRQHRRRRPAAAIQRRPAGPPCRPAPSTSRRRGAGRRYGAAATRPPPRRSAGRRRTRPRFCGVPTQTKCTSRVRRAVGEVGGEAEPAGRQRARRAARRRPGLVERRLGRRQRRRPCPRRRRCRRPSWPSSAMEAACTAPR